MCDTMVALPSATATGAVLFAKNSDRERNEAQFLEQRPAARHAPGSLVRCSYIDIPQSAETQAVLLSRPFWCWGAEIGANAAGVVAGNEAVFSRLLPPAHEPALVGMDLVRLALERATTAEAAVGVIIDLLERHGQGGDCGHLNEHFYDNAYLVADAREAFVLETVGRFWVAERVTRSRAISNALSIGRGAIWRASPGLIADAKARGFCEGAADFDFAAAHLDLERDAQSQGRARCTRAAELLARQDGALTPASMMAMLRDHGAAAEDDDTWHPARATGRTICMHAAGHDRRGQSTASMVSELHADGRVLHWVTGTAAPCLSIFKPVLMEAGLPPQGPRPADRWDATTRWWQHEALHRGAVLGDFGGILAALAPERDALETRFIRHMAEASPGQRAEAAAACWAEAEAWEASWRRRGLPRRFITDAGHESAWRELTARAEAGASGLRCAAVA
ncbi:peptidase C69 family protein [Neoroseomonas lacus]|uniref:Dipeptidase n=1 Tax=Neoroseomonas lacus TaxID=287609 RepID=A0A917L1Y9_9PROT|nr:peptidase U34 [Neoroseomonas lacus]GGJ37914.1 dipeptidase [Neoroseomonas lacus]